VLYGYIRLLEKYERSPDGVKKKPKNILDVKGDSTLTCSLCQKPFVFTAKEKKFYKEKRFSPPKRCKPCRDSKKQGDQSK
jgi:hypothetical protein